MPEKLNQFLKNCEPWLFPRIEIFNIKISTGKQIILFGTLLFLFSLTGRILKPGGMIGFDWIQFYSQGIVPPFYPPWTQNNC